jgi:hypothetical protein
MMPEHMQVLTVNYNAVLAEPRRHAQAIQQFLDRPLQLDTMVAVVTQPLYRNRAGHRRSEDSSGLGNDSPQY